MKTNQVLASADRSLFGITIRQQTKDQFLSVSDLQRAYEFARFQHGWSDKRISDILNTETTKERIYYLLQDRAIVKTTFPAFMEMVKSEGIAKVLKGLGVYKTMGRGENKTVACDPYIWVLLALELNPMIYAKVILWLTDSLIFDRIDAGSEYMPMNSAIKRIVECPDYPKYAKAINERVFGRHLAGMRNLASAKELRKIADIEGIVINAIEMGWLKNESDILKAIRGAR